MSCGARVAFECPLCAAALSAEIDEAGAFPIVADLEGCAHAAAFGTVGGLTLREEFELIAGALGAFELRNLRDGDGHPLCPICQTSVTRAPTIRAGRIAYHVACWRPFQKGREGYQR
jgi:hypothetical protein